MSYPKVIDYLKTHSFSELRAEHHVCARACVNNRKVSLNYDTIRAHVDDEIASECRGIVIASPSGLKSGWQDRTLSDAIVLAWPMSRFLNHGQGQSPIDWSSQLSVQEKLDGTMIVCYYDYYGDRWCTATRSVPEADIPIAGIDGTMTFSDLFKIALAETVGVNVSMINSWFLEHVVGFRRGMTYVFELTSPLNRVVVGYNSNRVTLIAARDNSTGNEVDTFNLDMWKIPRPATWALSSPAAIVAFVSAMSPGEFEGVVVRDEKFNREKIKHGDWGRMARAKSTLTPRSILLSIIVGDIDDIVPFIDNKTKALIDELREGYVELVDRIDAIYRRANVLESRRDFALAVKNEPGIIPHVCFNLRDGRVADVDSWFNESAKNDRLNDRVLDAIISAMNINVQKTA